MAITKLNSLAIPSVDASAISSINSSALPTGLSVDANGYVLTSSRPAFYAQFTHGGNSNPGSGNVAVFNFTHFNVGNNYSTSNSRFTAPVDGLYAFGTQMLTDNSGSRTILIIRINGSSDYNTTQAIEISSDSEEYNDAQGNVLFQLSSGDYVDVRVQVNYANLYASSGGQNFFYGYLVG